MRIDISGARHDYIIDAEIGIGSVKINNAPNTESSNPQTAENILRLKGGIGEVRINFDR